MNPETEQNLSALLTELIKCINNSSVAVRIADQQSDKFLSTAISKALTEYRARLKKEPAAKQEQQATEDNTDAVEQQTQELEKVKHVTIEAKDALEDVAGATSDVGNSLRENKSAIDEAIKSREKQNEAIKAASLKVVAAISTAVKAMVTRTIDETAKRLEWVQQLNDAGVKLRGGFDETFTELSNLSKRSHEEFTRLLTSNSNMIARMNTMGLRGEREIADMSQAIVGKYGYTVKTSDSIIKFMLDSRIKYMTEEELQTMNLTSEMELLAKNLRASSAAFGKSTEQILAETKAREDDYTDRMLQAKYGDAYRNMKLSGLPPELIRMFLTNVPNAEATKYLATSNGLQRIYNLMESNRKGLLNKETSLATWSKIMNDKSVKRFISEANDPRNIPFATIASNSPQVKSMNALSLMQRPDLANAEALTDNNTPEIRAINSLTDLKTSVNKLNNTINDKLSAKLGTLATAMDGLSLAIKGTNFMLGMVNPTLAKFVYGAGTAVGSVAADVLGSMLQIAFLSRALPFVKRFGYMKGLPLAMKSTGRFALRGAKGAISSAPGKLAAGYGLYRTGGSMLAKGARWGGTALAGLGTVSNMYSSYQEGASGEDSIGDYTMGALSGALTGAMAGAAFGPIGMGIGAAIGGLGSIITRAWGSSNAKSPAQSGVNTNNYNTTNENYTTQRTIYTDSEKESNDKELLANTREIANSMRWFVNNSKFQTSPMPFAVGK